MVTLHYKSKKKHIWKWIKASTSLWSFLLIKHRTILSRMCIIFSFGMNYYYCSNTINWETISLKQFKNNQLSVLKWKYKMHQKYYNQYFKIYWFITEIFYCKKRFIHTMLSNKLLHVIYIIWWYHFTITNRWRI